MPLLFVVRVVFSPCAPCLSFLIQWGGCFFQFFYWGFVTVVAPTKYLCLVTGCYLLGMSPYYRGSEVFAVVFTPILVEGNFIYCSWVRHSHSPYAHPHQILPIGTFHACQGCPRKAQEWGRIIRTKWQQTWLNPVSTDLQYVAHFIYTGIFVKQNPYA